MVDEEDGSGQQARVDHRPSTPTSLPASGPGAPRGGPLIDWLKGQVTRSFGPKLGRYVLLRVVGEGGMGVVFAAYDEELDRKVAIKLLRAPAGGPSLDRSLLLNEARAMAQLNHPNIVQVYDVGQVEEQLFLAMEFVVGESLQAWFQRERRGWRAVVDICAQAGRGLQAAHEAMLVHCDFKPANVLVGADGRARVLDFGVARLHGRAARSRQADDEASTSGVSGTPAYMAPEVYLYGEPDARSDLFAFCVTLYEALYGQRPFRGKGLEELRRTICAGELVPPPPSAGVPARLRDIVLRGLARDPAARWPNMQTLLAELERDPTRSRRRWALVAGVAATLTVGSLGAWRWRAAETAAALAACRAPEAELAALVAPERRAAIRQALVATGLPYAPRSADVVEAALSEFADTWTAVHAAACAGAVLEGALTPDMLALRDRCAARQVAEVSATIDVLVEADATVVDHVDQLAARLPDPRRCENLRVLAELADQGREDAVDPRRESLRAGLARVHVELDAGRARRAHELVTPLLAEAETLRDRTLRSEIFEVAAACADELGELDRADELELRGFTDALASDHVTIATAIAVARTARIGIHVNNFAEARLWSRIVAGLLDRAGDDPQRFIHTVHLGGIAIHERNYQESLAHFDRALELVERARPSPRDLAALHNNRGIALNYLGRHAEAVAAHELAIELVRGSFGDDHPNIATTLVNIGTIHVYAGELPEAIRTIRRSIEMNERLLGADNPRLALGLQNLAAVEIEAGALDDALAHATRARALLAGSVSDDHIMVGYVSTALGEAERQLGRLDAAIGRCTTGLSILEAALGPSHFHLMYPLTCLGECSLARGDPAGARAQLERALALVDDNPDITRSDRGHIQFALARALAGLGERDAARLHADQAVALYAAAGPSYQSRHQKAVAWRRTLGER